MGKLKQSNAGLFVLNPRPGPCKKAYNRTTVLTTAESKYPPNTL